MNEPSKSLRRTARAFSTGAAAILLAACAGSPTFEPGDSSDPIVRAALVASTSSTIQVTINNGTSYALRPGLLTFAPVHTVNQSASTALAAYLTGANAGNAEVFAANAGLALGVSAFVVPAIDANGTTTLIISAPAGAQLSYLARETIAAPDFVASFNPINWPNGSTGTFLTGFTLNPAGKISRGNSSVSPTPNIAVVAFDVAQNCGSAGTMAKPATLFSDDFKTGANSSLWPMNAGYDADFNGDWATDGITARVSNPANNVRPVTTGFVKFLDICPTGGATINVSANIDAAFTSLGSDATLVLYYFNAAGALIRVDANHKIGRGNVRRTALIDSAVPLTARRIAVAPMALLATDEANTLFFSKLRVTYAPQNTFAVTPIVNDTLATGAVQPSGWAEFGGDYFVMASNSWVTLWNSTWGGDQSLLPPVDTGLVKRFTMPTYASGDLLDARAFAAATFTDPTSFVRIRVLFNSATGATIASLDSDRLSQRSYANVELLHEPIPPGVATIDVILNAYLGPTETSSFYAQRLSVNTKRQVLK